ncbi:MAG: hypothetical protein JXB85_10805 [Anaerolineales bacterium]|nr:hypothetical protein [Anaerolineales bacterium]
MLKGKGFFTFILSETEGGDPTAIVAAAQFAGLSHVLVKIADGAYPFGVNQNGSDTTLPVVQALRAAGIAVGGWHYVYGDDPIGEAAIAVRRVTELALDSYVIDAEEEYKRPGKAYAARRFMNEIRPAIDRPIVLCSYRFPNYHPELPWSTFLEQCDYNMPQMYWEAAHNAAWQLRESKRQCDALPNARPYLATGPAYGAGGWAPTVEDIHEFLDTARALDIPAVNFFQWGYCRRHLPAIWKAISDYPWPVAPLVSIEPEPDGEPGLPAMSATGIALPDPFSNKYLAALNSRSGAEMAALYASTAVHVRDEKVIRNTTNIQNDYKIFFQSLPTDNFSLTKVEGGGDIRYINWRTGIRVGKSAILLRNGKIILDFLQLI